MSGRFGSGFETGLLACVGFDFGFDFGFEGAVGVAAGGSSVDSNSGKSSSKTLLPAVIGDETSDRVAVCLVLAEQEMFGDFGSFCSTGVNRDSSGAVVADGWLGMGAGVCVTAFFGFNTARLLGVGTILGSGGLSSESQSSSSLFVSTTPGTRIGDEHLGQTSFCPARFDGALSFFSHFGHAKLRSSGLTLDKAWPRVGVACRAALRLLS